MAAARRAHKNTNVSLLMSVARALSVDRQVSTHPHQRAEEKEEDDRCDPAHAGEVHAELSLAVAIAKWSVSIESLNLNRKSSLNRNQYGTCMGLDAKASMPHLDNIEAPEKRDEQEQPAVGHCHRHSGGK